MLEHHASQNVRQRPKDDYWRLCAGTRCADPQRSPLGRRPCPRLLELCPVVWTHNVQIELGDVREQRGLRHSGATIPAVAGRSHPRSAEGGVPVRRRARATVVPSRGINIQLQTCSRIVVLFCYLYLFIYMWVWPPPSQPMDLDPPSLPQAWHLFDYFLFLFTHEFIPILFGCKTA